MDRMPSPGGSDALRGSASAGFGMCSGHTAWTFIMDNPTVWTLALAFLMVVVAESIQQVVTGPYS